MNQAIADSQDLTTRAEPLGQGRVLLTRLVARVEREESQNRGVAVMDRRGELLPVEDNLRPEYDLTKLVRLPAEKLHFRRRPKREPLELTTGFPAFEEGPPPGFEWDPAKAACNFRKHGVTFNEASTVFDNPHARETYDPDHSEEEDRYLLIGHSARGQVLIISYTDREDRTRIISARKAEPRERREYEDGAIR